MNKRSNEAIELLRHVRRIEIKAKRLSSEVFAGTYQSAFRGRGMAFNQVRPYAVGDDVRDIDWNVTARYHKPFVKEFDEERELSVMLLIDVSGSLEFGTEVEPKRKLCTEIAATLAFSAIQGSDKVGAVLFSDRVEKYIPPRSGRSHILYIIRELLGFASQSSQTDISVPLMFLRKVVKKHCTVFLISDMMAETATYEQALTIASRRHDLVNVRVYDRHDYVLPSIGLTLLRDAETKREHWVDTSSKKLREALRQQHERMEHERTALLDKCHIDRVEVRTGQDYVPGLIRLFNRRK
ncbi:MAG: DUF58 domain-containing protein [Porphyromonas sp.]|nr:DUF58 domain-containing protein [Porphyromonas sp.]